MDHLGAVSPFWCAPVKSFNLPNDTGDWKNYPQSMKEAECSRWVAKVAAGWKSSTPHCLTFTVFSSLRKEIKTSSCIWPEPTSHYRWAWRTSLEHTLPLWTAFVLTRAAKEAPMDRGARWVWPMGLQKECFWVRLSTAFMAHFYEAQRSKFRFHEGWFVCLLKSVLIYHLLATDIFKYISFKNIFLKIDSFTIGFLTGWLRQ